jgi:hypothetical protein
MSLLVEPRQTVNSVNNLARLLVGYETMFTDSRTPRILLKRTVYQAAERVYKFSNVPGYYIVLYLGTGQGLAFGRGFKHGRRGIAPGVPLHRS